MKSTSQKLLKNNYFQKNEVTSDTGKKERTEQTCAEPPTQRFLTTSSSFPSSRPSKAMISLHCLLLFQEVASHYFSITTPTKHYKCNSLQQSLDFYSAISKQNKQNPMRETDKRQRVHYIVFLTIYLENLLLSSHSGI